MALEVATDAYLNFNTQQTKQLAIVIEIEGLDTKLSSRPIFSTNLYGDPDLEYGAAGLFYGQMFRREDVLDILQIDKSSLVISQKVEPEQGKGSISMLTLAFIDKDQFMSRLIAPGILLDDIMGKQVKVFLGYKELNFPSEYFVVFRGRVSGAYAESGSVKLQLSDPNLKRRNQIFFSAKSPLTAGISDVDTTIPVVANADFFEQILGPDGSFDTAVKTYLLIDDEIIEYGSGGFGVNEFTGVTRGARGTTAVAHDIDTEVAAAIQLEEHAIDLALKLMLSGQNGAWKTDQAIAAFVVTGDPSLGDISNAIILPVDVDGKRDLGLVAGDSVTSSGATIGANDKTADILAFEDLAGTENRILLMDDTYLAELASPALLALRSQYDTLPVKCGVKVTPPEVDIEQHLFVKNTFLGTDDFSYRFFLQEEEDCKAFLESQVYLPYAMYSLTRQGKLSVVFTKPPLADQRLQTLNKTNVINPAKIQQSRALNNRKFFNEIDWTWDEADGGEFASREKTVDTTSLNVIGISGVLPIESRGGKTDKGYQLTIARRTRFLLNRYQQGAVMLRNIQVNWQVGSLIEAGDVVLLEDNGELQISNPANGERNFESALLEVIDRRYDFKSGKVTLTLLTGIGAEVDDRFATISPSSLVDANSTTTRIIIKPSFGQLFGIRERDKWADYEGLPIRVHSADYTFDEEVTITALPADNLLAIDVSPALSVPPSVDFIVDIVDYSTSTDPLVNQLYKLIHVHLTPSVDVVSGASTTSFDVGAGDIGKFAPGQLILIHNDDFSVESPEVEVDTVGATTVTVKTSLGFTPAAGQTVELIGFADGGGPYRFI